MTNFAVHQTFSGTILLLHPGPYTNLELG